MLAVVNNPIQSEFFVNKERSLFTESRLLKALSVYDGQKIPPNTSIVLSSQIFDGIGDLEHIIHAARHLMALRRQENVKLSAWIERGYNVPEKAWNEKLKILNQIGLDAIYLVGLVSLEHIEKAIEASKQMALEEPGPCIINVSGDTQVYFNKRRGCIPEYGLGILEMDFYIKTGFQKDTAGLWISDDPVFSANDPRVSNETRTILFGSPLSDEEMQKWEVGFASLIKDTARLAWIELRLNQVDPTKNCSLVLSNFICPIYYKSILKLAKVHHFGSWSLINASGEKSTANNIGSGKRILRIVHQFVAEEDFVAVIHLAQKGSLGGAGDTACVHGLRGEYPLFVDACRTGNVWEKAVEYLNDKKFLLLEKWFNACVNNQYDELYVLIKDENLIHEWNIFRNAAMRDLDIGPWVDRLVRRSVFASGKNEEKILDVEQAFLRDQMSYSDYAEKVGTFCQTVLIDEMPRYSITESPKNIFADVIIRAASQGFPNVVIKMLEMGPLSEIDHRNAIIKASQTKHENRIIIRALLTCRILSQDTRDSAVKHAIGSGNWEILEELLATTLITVDYRGRLVVFAANYGQWKIILNLLENGGISEVHRSEAVWKLSKNASFSEDFIRVIKKLLENESILPKYLELALNESSLYSFPQCEAVVLTLLANKEISEECRINVRTKAGRFGFQKIVSFLSPL